MKNRIMNWGKSKILKDSLFAVFGNGFGHALLLLSGILIARLLGRDLYGEYGLVKTNMFYMAGFATFGLGFTTTKFVAQYFKENPSFVLSIVKSASCITLVFSSLLALFLVLLSSELADFLETPSLTSIFKYLSFIIILKALATTGTGILSGMGCFKDIARNSVISGVAMLLLCVPFTYFEGLNGSLLALALSQFLNAALNYRNIFDECKKLPSSKNRFTKKLLMFSFPIAMQELSFAFCNWGAIVLLTKMSTIGEVGIYSATAQWNAVIMFLPSILANVVLSHLSSTVEKTANNRLLKKILGVYLLCTLIPFVLVYIATPFIVSMYGSDFATMDKVLRLIVFATIPMCCSDVFKSELIALGKPWHLFVLRLFKDLLLLMLTYTLLSLNSGVDGAFYFAIATVLSSIAFFVAICVDFKIVIK